MGMFSEINAEATAKQLEHIILDLIQGDDWIHDEEVRSIAKQIAKQKLY
jgi:hypothetical protein